MEGLQREQSRAEEEERAAADGMRVQGQQDTEADEAQRKQEELRRAEDEQRKQVELRRAEDEQRKQVELRRAEEQRKQEQEHASRLTTVEPRQKVRARWSEGQGSVGALGGGSCVVVMSLGRVVLRVVPHISDCDYDTSR